MAMGGLQNDVWDEDELRPSRARRAGSVDQDRSLSRGHAGVGGESSPASSPASASARFHGANGAPG